MRQTYADTVFYSFMVKYDRLRYIINHAYGNSSASEINLFIDLYSIYKRLYNSNDLVFSQDSTIAGQLLRICNHYRLFFRSTYNVECNIFLIDSANCPSVNAKLLYGYNRSYIEQMKYNNMLTDMVNGTASILSKICNFIHNVSYVYSDFETGVVIRDIINKLNTPGIPNLIITKDVYNYQLVSESTYLLRLKKHNGDESYIISPENVMESYLSAAGFKDVNINKYKLYPHLIPIMMTFTKLPERSIKSIINSNVIANQLHCLMDQEFIISNSVNLNVKYYYDILYNTCQQVKDIPFPIIESRFKAISIDYQYNICYNTINTNTDFMGIVNIYDPELLRRYLEEYFSAEEIGMILNL